MFSITRKISVVRLPCPVLIGRLCRILLSVVLGTTVVIKKCSSFSLVLLQAFYDMRRITPSIAVLLILFIMDNGLTNVIRFNTHYF